MRQYKLPKEKVKDLLTIKNLYPEDLTNNHQNFNKIQSTESIKNLADEWKQ